MGRQLDQRKSQHPPKHFNFFGFFGCCYKCKHEPQCTSKCMKVHHIPNGYDEAQEMDSETNTEASKDYTQAAQVLQFIQIAATSSPAADQTIHYGSERSKAAEDQKDAKEAGMELNQMSSACLVSAVPSLIVAVQMSTRHLRHM